MIQQNLPRKKLCATLLAMGMPGLGQIYNGELIKAACLLLFFITAPVLISETAVFLPDNSLICTVAAAIGASFAIYLFADRKIYQNSQVHVGDIIIHVFPDDRSKVYIRQVAALPGEHLTTACRLAILRLTAGVTPIGPRTRYPVGG